MLLAFGRDPGLGFRAKSAMFTLRPRLTTAPLFPASSSLLSASRGFLPGCILLVALWWTCGNATAAALTDQQAKWVSHAHRESRHGWIYLRIQGSAEERGFQHGYLRSEEHTSELQSRVD